MSIENTNSVGSTDESAAHADQESILSHHPSENSGNADDTSTKLNDLIEARRNNEVRVLRNIVLERLGWMRSYIGVTHEALLSSTAEDVVQKIRAKLNGNIPYQENGEVDHAALRSLVKKNFGSLLK